MGNNIIKKYGVPYPINIVLLGNKNEASLVQLNIKTN